jgi:hypothetical protein
MRSTLKSALIEQHNTRKIFESILNFFQQAVTFYYLLKPNIMKIAIIGATGCGCYFKRIDIT